MKPPETPSLQELITLDTEVKTQVNQVLVRSWRPEGVPLWWDRPRHQLDGKTPEQVWPENPVAVARLAISGLDQQGS